jgi:phosphohistidine phosphatase
MKRLILLRHAKSSWKELDLPDFERPLNARGKKNAPMMGRRMRLYSLGPDIIISSPAKRAWQTAELIAKEIGSEPAQIIAAPEIYEAPCATLIELIQGFDSSWDSVLLVGHNPGITDLDEFLSGERLCNMPTSAVCCIDFSAKNWREVSEKSGRIYHYDYPKKTG